MTDNLFFREDNGAIFSDDRKYRYVLWRVWNDSLPKVMFVGLNPSTANEDTDDPTIRKVKIFAKDWGFGGIYMLNLFTYVTAYPKELKKCDNPILHADRYLNEYAQKCDKIILAWGNFQEAEGRAFEVLKILNGDCLGINKNGSPKHPLYLKKDIIPIKYIR